ncbi:hypothetical protein [Rhizobium tubonense]|uniref:S1/P1 Nuclease n=1 Tax=Rhizobium tubonense TaxID=484088 RepID=A0A2W4C9L6_9HYPH|nr:hypothetical protein [Rhizobium tubonense]PZM08058.1 hypothetical protein CPY51_30405 [Rhizobium tubonense]
MDSLFKSSSTFASLSLKDLLDARDLFHYHLMNKKNVVATAVGLYRIRSRDPWPSEDNPKPEPKSSNKDTKRTLANSEVRPYSWPCVYVFVSKWEFEAELAKEDPSDMVPKTLYLPDGRSVPVCVVEARRDTSARGEASNPAFLPPRNLLCPGSILVNSDGQGLTRFGTAGAIVTNGERYYVVTNRHVTGAAGTKIKALQGHRDPIIGSTSSAGLSRVPFGEVYPNFTSHNQSLQLDVGLVDIDDISQWKSQTPGIGTVGSLLDLYDNSFTLKLITMKVVGVGGVSGPIRAEIHALFYRYRSLGGSEYVSDFLIGPETIGVKRKHQKEALAVHHGDSGTLLFIEHFEDEVGNEESKGKLPVYYPFAQLWGKEEFLQEGKSTSHPYALATALSPALDRLNMEFVADLNADQRYIWGWVGHYAIGRALTLPTDSLHSSKLRTFIANNIDLLSLTPSQALKNDPKVLVDGGAEPQFVPLADVPDNVWKSNVNFTFVDAPNGGKKRRKPGPGSRGQNDNPNHFADLDLNYKGQLFLQLNKDNPDQYLKPTVWVDYFAELKPRFDAWDDAVGHGRSNHWGALPFRVHQLFDIMVAAAKASDADLFLCAGGVLIHYVGDACQPLHTSYLSQGDPDQLVDRPRSPGKKMQADGVHGGYEDDMIAFGYQQKNLANALKDRINALPTVAAETISPIRSGYDASKAIIDLVSATQNEIAPRTIVSKWVDLIGSSKAEKAEAMWVTFGDKTVTCMARGTRYLAAIWQAAWELGGGDGNIGSGSSLKEENLMALYNNPDKMPSVALNVYPDDIAADWALIKRQTSTSG